MELPVFAISTCSTYRTLVRRSSNPIEIGALELSLGSGRASPQERSGTPVPIRGTRLQGRNEQIGTVEVASRQGALPEDLPEALDQVQPGRGCGYRDEVEARMAPIPQHRVHRPVQGQGVDDEMDP